jgi:hypothetical protein
MRSSTRTPTGLDLDLRIVAVGIVRTVASQMTKALANGLLFSRTPRQIPKQAR